VTALYVLIAIEAAYLVIAGAVIVHGLAAGSITWRRRRSAGGAPHYEELVKLARHLTNDPSSYEHDLALARLRTLLAELDQ
jgi:hypothetical protein